jgi:hypothetical protein
MYVRVKAEH